MIKIGIKLELLITYYLQTNKQTEQINQTLEIFLRYYVNHSQKNWVQLLFMIQLALNNRIVIVIEESAFYMNFGRHSNLFNVSKKSP